MARLFGTDGVRGVAGTELTIVHDGSVDLSLISNIFSKIYKVRGVVPTERVNLNGEKHAIILSGVFSYCFVHHWRKATELFHFSENGNCSATFVEFDTFQYVD